MPLRSVFFPVEATRALQIFTTPGLSLEAKLQLAGCTHGISGTANRDSAVRLIPANASGVFLILQIQFEEQALSELAGFGLVDACAEGLSISGPGMQRLLETHAYVGMSTTLECHNS